MNFQRLHPFQQFPAVDAVIKGTTLKHIETALIKIICTILTLTIDDSVILDTDVSCVEVSNPDPWKINTDLKKIFLWNN